MVELTLGFWLPVLASAVLEAKEYRQWKQARQHAAQRGAGQQTAAPRQLRIPWGQRVQQRVYREINAMLDGQDPTGPTLALMLLAGTWGLLALATPA